MMDKQLETETERVPRWIDLLVALWMAIATASFAIKFAMDAGIMISDIQPLVILARYSYAIMLIGCGVGVGLTAVRKFMKVQ